LLLPIQKKSVAFFDRKLAIAPDGLALSAAFDFLFAN
jgi:hypothetical protein